ADEFVQRLALVVLLVRAVRRVGRVERAWQGGAHDAHALELRAHARGDLLHAVLDGFDTRIAVLAEVIDAFEPDHGADAREVDDIALDARGGGRPAGEGLLRRIFRRADHLIAADAGIEHDRTGAGGMEPPRQSVRPAIIAIHRRRGAVGDRIAEADDHL